ncbi:hypothetical protein CANCADRAFT_106217 [Tortispora caseinolytica NRRL Y-17796]|uniref:Uncharacterized protein n=1 Tax=Tortispora caseinolytica NRRL Y-17796 TaxID=767744 RepID=A0A1E4TFA1_9ASCO|nr:hypothetical protein CANCADRAFT_106217 [Tortispora caseinolytica NRRL Y-17796]
MTHHCKNTYLSQGPTYSGESNPRVLVGTLIGLIKQFHPKDHLQTTRRPKPSQKRNTSHLTYSGKSQLMRTATKRSLATPLLLSNGRCAGGNNSRSPDHPVFWVGLIVLDDRSHRSLMSARGTEMRDALVRAG